MAKSFIELVKGNEPIFFINALCGLGDVISHLTRLPAVEDKYPDHTICFLLGGFSGSPKLMKETIERQGYFASIIKNYNFHSQHDNIESFIVGKYVKESRGDKYESWSFCREIFLWNPSHRGYMRNIVLIFYNGNFISVGYILVNFWHLVSIVSNTQFLSSWVKINNKWHLYNHINKLRAEIVKTTLQYIRHYQKKQ